MKIRPIIAAEAIFLSFVFLLANIRSTIFWSLYPPLDTIFAPAWRETLLWLIALFLMYYLLTEYGLSQSYLDAWRWQPLLIVFVLFSLASIFWSTSWAVTLHRFLAFAFGSAMAVYLSVRYSLRQFLRVLTMLGAIVLTASYVMVFFVPALGADINYNGAWRGIFWHKNQFGNILPIFTLVFMIYFFHPIFATVFLKKQLWFYCICYRWWQFFSRIRRRDISLSLSSMSFSGWLFCG